MTLTLLFGILGSVGGLGSLVAVAYVVPTRRKLGAETALMGVTADDMLSRRTLEMFKEARTAAESAERKAQACRDELDLLRDHIDELERLMRAAGMTPPPAPKRLHQIGGSP